MLCPYNCSLVDPRVDCNVPVESGFNVMAVEECWRKVLAGRSLESNVWAVEHGFNASAGPRQCWPVKIRPRSGLCFLAIIIAAIITIITDIIIIKITSLTSSSPISSSRSPSSSNCSCKICWDIGMQSCDTVDDISDRIWCWAEGGCLLPTRLERGCGGGVNLIYNLSPIIAIQQKSKLAEITKIEGSV